jgi:hypothetical protein
MKKQVLVLLALLGTSQLEAETLAQVYFPFFGLLSLSSSDYSIFGIYKLPLEIRQTIAKFPFADLMVTGGLSFYFEDKALRSINLSAGLTFGYGYHENEHFLIFRLMNITLYPLYEFPLAISGKTPVCLFAIDFSTELMQIQPKSLKFGHTTPISCSTYLRGVGVYIENRVFVLPYWGISIGFIF